MALAWFICPMITTDTGSAPFHWRRKCAMDNFTLQILADGGDWMESEVLGNVALVKVRASDATLTAIQGAAGYLRVLAKINLTETMTDLSAAQRNAIQTRLLNMGYTQAEIDAAMGTNLTQWRQRTFGDLLRLICTKRLKPLSIDANGNVTFSSTVVTPTPPEILAGRII